MSVEDLGDCKMPARSHGNPPWTRGIGLDTEISKIRRTFSFPRLALGNFIALKGP